GAVEVVKTVDELAGKDFDVVVDYAGFGETTAKALDAIRFGGSVVVVGMGRLEATINTRDLILKQARILGSVGGTKEDVAACYELFAAGKVSPAITRIGFDDIPDGLDRLRRGEVTGRLVAVMDVVHGACATGPATLCGAETGSATATPPLTRMPHRHGRPSHT